MTITPALVPTWETALVAGTSEHRRCACLKLTVDSASKKRKGGLTHSRSRTARRAVTRKQAALCCRMMSSLPASILFTAATTLTFNCDIFGIECHGNLCYLTSPNTWREAAWMRKTLADPAWATHTPRPASVTPVTNLDSSPPTAIVSSSSFVTGLSTLIW